jgi:hypothetical protein
MTIARRLTTSAIALTLAVGGAVAVPAAASAATTYRFVSTGIQTKALCDRAEGLNQAHIVRNGGRILAGSSCTWQGSAKKWGYNFLYSY